jgi:hypothetical protein
VTCLSCNFTLPFLYGKLNEEVYIEIPDGVKIKDEKNNVLKLNKALYGLKQAPRMWNHTLVKFINELKFKQLKTDMCIFKNQYLIIAIYVDDIIIMVRESKKIQEFKNHIHTKFKTKDRQVKFSFRYKN